MWCAALYARYKALADRQGNVHFCGRLANYRYLNMDQVVAQALLTYRQIAEQEDVSYTPVEVGATLTNAGLTSAGAMTALTGVAAS